MIFSNRTTKNLISTREEFMASIEAVHGERATAVAESALSIMMIQKELIAVSATLMGHQDHSKEDIKESVLALQKPMTQMLSRTIYLMTEDMEEKSRDDFVKTLVQFAIAISKQTDVDQ